MNNFLVFRIGWRYFKTKKNEKFISIISTFSLLGIMIGVAALIVVMAVMNGFHKEFTNSVIGLNGDIYIKPIYNSIENFEDIKKDASIDQISIIPLIVGKGLALGKKKNTGVLIKGITFNDLQLKNQ